MRPEPIHRVLLGLILVLTVSGCRSQRAALGDCLAVNSGYAADLGLPAYQEALRGWERQLIEAGALQDTSRQAYRELIGSVTAGAPLPDPEALCERYPERECWLLTMPTAYTAYPFCMAGAAGPAWARLFEEYSRTADGDAYYASALELLSERAFREGLYRNMFSQWLLTVASRQRDAYE